MSPASLPWTTAYPPICGGIEYTVLFNGSPVPDNWVTINPATLEITASPLVAPGTYVFELYANIDMAIYSNITSSRPFQVIVDPCQTGLDLTGLALQDQERVWYQSTLTYSVASVLNSV